MTIRQLAEFEQLNERLQMAGNSQAAAEIAQLKQRAEEIWNDLLLIDPAKKENTYRMIEFFLEQIREDKGEDLVNQQCKWKILALTRSLIDGQSDMHRSGGGRI